ncbi:MAG: hypothetical protein C4518_12310 [Desulfobacteraceae bacterium]|nr:MAG: hypothetical protein C4518_12310 [Desulfobacteraceae bacterium]
MGFGWRLADTAAADDHSENKKHFGREGHDEFPANKECDEKGNETAGQIAAWLLAIANLPVAVSISTRWANRSIHLRSKCKNILTDLNRFQKKHLMGLHYYLNPVVGVVAFWHWLTSCCRSTALPEWGLLILISMITLGIILKWKFCPKPFQKIVYQIHTQPFIFIAMIMVLTIGHMIVD